MREYAITISHTSHFWKVLRYWDDGRHMVTNKLENGWREGKTGVWMFEFEPLTQENRGDLNRKTLSKGH